MVSKTNELALEKLIEKVLTGTCREKITIDDLSKVKEQSEKYVALDNHGYQVGKTPNFNKQFAIDEQYFWQFLQATQKEELEKLQRSGNDWQRKIIERFDRLIKKYGLLHLLKKGLSVDNAHLKLSYPAPLASSSESVKKNFTQNIFSCTRQVTYSTTNPLEEVDVVLFINGLPFATLELKNPWTGQTARYHGQKQYRNDRDPSQTLLQFGRCLVHMAVDMDDVYMTTKLAGKNTFFLPFN